MSNRLDQEKEKKVEPERIRYALEKLSKKEDEGIIEMLSSDTKKVTFFYNKKECVLFPYSGWFSGKSIKGSEKAGRGIGNLLKQLT